MFQFPPCASLPYFTQIRIIRYYSDRVSPFGHIRVNALLAAHRTLSWLQPSFFASMSQGIHLVPWVAYHIISDAISSEYLPLRSVDQMLPSASFSWFDNSSPIRRSLKFIWLNLSWSFSLSLSIQLKVTPFRYFLCSWFFFRERNSHFLQWKFLLSRYWLISKRFIFGYWLSFDHQ